VPDTAEAAHVAIDRDVVGWIGEHELRLGVAQEPDIRRGIPGVGAQEKVLTELPEVTGASDRISARISRDLIFRATRLVGGFPHFLEAQINFGRLEARQLDLKVEVN
jgi:hypothetical protein